jgi:PHD-finger
MLGQDRVPNSAPSENAPQTVVPAFNQHTIDYLQSVGMPECSLNIPPTSEPQTTESTISDPLQIPRLSTATAELLARVKGNSPALTNWNLSVQSLVADNSNSNTNMTVTMKASSTILELPTAPSHTPIARTVTRTVPPKPLQPNSTRSGLVAIAPRPAGATGAPSQPIAATPPASSQRSPLTTAKRPKAGGPRQGQSTPNNTKCVKRRKRNQDSDDDNIRADNSSSDERSKFVPIATQTKSGRQVHRPIKFVPSTSASRSRNKALPPDVLNGTAAFAVPLRKRRRLCRKGKEPSANCTRCQRGHSPSTNMIVFCDECNRAWHQFCHDPPIEKEVVAVKEREWFCRNCRFVEPEVMVAGNCAQNGTLGSFYQAPQVAPIAVENRVGGEDFSTADRHCYLSGLSHDTLVNLVLEISNRNPTLPIFPSHLKALQTSEPVSLNPLASGPVISDPKTAPPGPDNICAALLKAQAAAEPLAEGRSSFSSRPKDDDDSAGDSGSEYEFEEHRLYPRAGNGFRLPPLVDDLDMLLEDPASPTFSYTIHKSSEAMETTGLVCLGAVA